jgi:hypothetical protein
VPDAEDRLADTLDFSGGTILAPGGSNGAGIARRAMLVDL